MLRWASSTYPQLQSIPKMLDKMTVADFPIIVGSIDPCFSCTERVVTVDTRSKNVRVYTKQELLAMSQRNSGQGRRS